MGRPPDSSFSPAAALAFDYIGVSKVCYLYTYIKRERERDIERDICMYTYIYIYIYRSRERESMKDITMNDTIP